MGIGPKYLLEGNIFSLDRALQTIWRLPPLSRALARVLDDVPSGTADSEGPEEVPEELEAQLVERLFAAPTAPAPGRRNAEPAATGSQEGVQFTHRHAGRSQQGAALGQLLAQTANRANWLTLGAAAIAHRFPACDCHLQPPTHHAQG